MPPTRRAFLESATLALTPQCAIAQSAGRGGVRLQLVRNATCMIEYAGQALLLDPWLSEAGAMAAITNTPNPRPNPLVPLPSPCTWKRSMTAY